MSVLKKVVRLILDFICFVCDGSQKASEESYEENLKRIERQKREVFYR